MSKLPDIPPLRKLTEAEFATIGRVILVWGTHEQNVGSIVGAGLNVPRDANVPLVHVLGYGRKVDLACQVLEATQAPALSDLAKELDYVRRVFRPERDTLAHGAFGMWAEDAWVRAIAKDRFVIFDELDKLYDRAEYARVISVEAVCKLQGYYPEQPRPPRPSAPSRRVPNGWLS